MIAGLACLLTSLCYAEVSALIPSAGGSFTYARVTLGRFPAWLIGWCMVMEYLIAASTVATGWSGYAQNLLAQLGWVLPRAWTGAPFDLIAGRLVASDRILDVPAVVMIVACTWVLVRGVRHSAIANAAMVAIKLTVIILVIGVGSFYVTPSNWIPFIPARQRRGPLRLGRCFHRLGHRFFLLFGLRSHVDGGAREP